jgi:FkbM family methyltransferase
VTTAIAYLRQAAFWVLSYLPGRPGEAFETRWYWARRRTGGGATQMAFRQSLAALDAGSLCIDLGANVGKISGELARTGARVHAFEPDPWAFGQLRDRLGGLANVTLHNAAIGARDGTATLMRDPDFDQDRAVRSEGTSAFRSLLWQEGEADAFEVEQVGICRFLRELDRPVDLIKVDIEGAEVELLEALLDAPERDRVKVMFVETHEAQMPELRPRLKALRRRIKALEHPVVYLNWQ